MATDMEWTESWCHMSLEIRGQYDSSEWERWAGSYGDMKEDRLEKSKASSRRQSKDRSKSSGQREDRDRSKDRGRWRNGDGKDSEKEIKDLVTDRVSSGDRRRGDKDEQQKEMIRDRPREKDTNWYMYKDKKRERDSKDQGKEREGERDKERELGKDTEIARDKERGKRKIRNKEKEQEKESAMLKVCERKGEWEQHKDRENNRKRSRNVCEKEKVKERTREREKKETDQDKERLRDKERSRHKQWDEGHERSKDVRKDDKSHIDSEDDVSVAKQRRGSIAAEDEAETLQHQESMEDETAGSKHSTSELVCISKLKEERLKKKSEGASEMLAWVNRSRKLEERNAERENALHLSRIFEEQDNMNQGESDEEVAKEKITHDLSGVKVLHGIEKVLKGGAVVLTLKDQSILADGGINEEADVLEDVEIEEQKQRDEAYKAAKRKTAIYVDRFNDDPGSERKLLHQYDDLVTYEGMTLDSSGHFTGEAEKKLEELQRRIRGVSTSKNFKDLNASLKMVSDYYTEEGMVKFEKPKKKKLLREKEILDYDALEAEAKSCGLGLGDLGVRNSGKRQALKEDEERNEAEMRISAYKSVVAKADKASQALRGGRTHIIQAAGDESPVIGGDDEEFQKSLKRAGKLALEKQRESVKSASQPIALLASSN